MNDDRTIVDYSESKSANVVPHATISIIATIFTPIGTTKWNLSFLKIIIGFVLQTEMGKVFFENPNLQGFASYMTHEQHHLMMPSLHALLLTLLLTLLQTDCSCMPLIHGKYRYLVSCKATK